MKILITTGIYPPKIGGPAQYAKNLKNEFEKIGHKVVVKTFGIEDKLPTGLRHLYFLIKIIRPIIWAEAIFILDTFSVGLPTVFACKLLGKKSIIRTGGDFLWEQYVERTRKKVLLRNFYDTEKENFSLKEKIIFISTKWTLQNVSRIVFSTNWQRDIFVKAYGLELGKTTIVENYYGEKETDFNYESLSFIASARNLVWKNLDVLRNVFKEVCLKHPQVELFLNNMPYEEFTKKMSKSYAVILVSLGDISPNIILDAIRFNRPFICTREIGIYDRLRDAGIFVDPQNPEETKNAVLDFLTEEGYNRAKEKVRKFNFVHNWEEIARELISAHHSIQESGPKNILVNIFRSFIAVRYFLCGITAAATNIVVLYLLTDLAGIWYLASSVLAFLVALIVSFSLQKFVVFQDKITSKLHTQFMKFFVAALLGITTNTILVFVCVEWLKIWYILSQIIAGFFVMIQNYTVYNLFIFKSKKCQK